MKLRSAFSCRVFSGFAFVITGLCGTDARAGSLLDSITQEVRAVFERSKNAVVKIEAVDEHGRLAGTGFFIDPNGTIYTAYTVGGESHDIVVSHGDMKWIATRLLGDSRSGIAILKVEAQTPFLPLGKSETLAVASPVIAVGYPMDLPLSPNFGTVGGFDIVYLGHPFVTAHIRANVPVQRGEGGAPLLNENGEVVGILISSIDSGSGCFALPIEAAEKVRKDFMRFGEARPGWLGICVGEAPHETEGSLALVDDLVEGAPAEKFGVQKGDVLLQIGDKKITSRLDMLNASFYITAGDEIPIAVSRKGEKLSLKVQAADHPSMTHRIAPASPEVKGILLSSPH